MAGNSTVLDIKDISVCFDGFYALTEVNAAVKRHSIRPQAALSSIRRAARMCA